MASRFHKLGTPDRNVVLACGPNGVISKGESVFFVVYGEDVDSGTLLDSKRNLYSAVIETPEMALYAGVIRHTLEANDSLTFEGAHDTSKVQYIGFTSGDFSNEDRDVVEEFVKPGLGHEADKVEA